MGGNVLDNIYKKYEGREGKVMTLLPKAEAVKITTHRGDIIVPVRAIDKVEVGGTSAGGGKRRKKSQS